MSDSQPISGLTHASSPRRLGLVVVRCALAGAGARKAMSEMKQAIPTALLTRQTTSGQAPRFWLSGRLRGGKIGAPGPEEFLARPAYRFGWQRRVTSNSEVGRDS